MTTSTPVATTSFTTFAGSTGTLTRDNEGNITLDLRRSTVPFGGPSDYERLRSLAEWIRIAKAGDETNMMLANDRRPVSTNLHLVGDDDGDVQLSMTWGADSASTLLSHRRRDDYADAILGVIPDDPAFNAVGVTSYLTGQFISVGTKGSTVVLVFSDPKVGTITVGYAKGSHNHTYAISGLTDGIKGAHDYIMFDYHDGGSFHDGYYRYVLKGKTVVGSTVTWNLHPWVPELMSWDDPIATITFTDEQREKFHDDLVEANRIAKAYNEPVAEEPEPVVPDVTDHGILSVEQIEELARRTRKAAGFGETLPTNDDITHKFYTSSVNATLDMLAEAGYVFTRIDTSNPNPTEAAMFYGTDGRTKMRVVTDSHWFGTSDDGMAFLVDAYDSTSGVTAKVNFWLSERQRDEFAALVAKTTPVGSVRVPDELKALAAKRQTLRHAYDELRNAGFDWTDDTMTAMDAQIGDLSHTIDMMTSDMIVAVMDIAENRVYDEDDDGPF